MLDKFFTLKNGCYEEYKGFLKVAFGIHPCYILWPSLLLFLDNYLSKFEFAFPSVAADSFFLAKENAHFRAERDQVKGYLSEKEPQIIIIWLS
jgi:hypothetical protein